jgi:hypothetical protein
MVIYGDPGPDYDPDRDYAEGIVNAGTIPMMFDRTHECSKCGREFWEVRSRLDGWQRALAWRSLTTLGLLVDGVTGWFRRGRPGQP